MHRVLIFLTTKRKYKYYNESSVKHPRNKKKEAILKDRSHKRVIIQAVIMQHINQKKTK